MTTGEFTSFPVDAIWVDRADRQRKELKGIESLAESIARVGLIHPPVIQRDGKLRTGETRWEAVKSLGWTHIPVQFVEDLDEPALQELELEENVRRTDIPWEDECMAIQKYHDLQLQRDPEWTQTATAERLGMSVSQVNNKLSVAKQLVAGVKRVTEAPKFSVALGVTRRVEERAKASAVTGAVAKAPLNIKLPSGLSIENKQVPIVPKKVPLLNESFIDWAAAYSGNPFNMIHCDFPYGVNADKHDQGQAAAQGGYADSFAVYEQLVETLAANMDTVVAPSSHLVFWFSMDYYQWTLDRLTSMGWKVNPFPLIWYKSDNTGILPDPKRGPRRNYETAFMASRGDRLLTAKGAVSNVAAFPGRKGDDSIHMSQKSASMLTHFLQMVVDEHSTFLDPTCGSASAVKVAQKLGAKSVLGLEIDTEFYTRAKESYYGTEE